MEQDKTQKEIAVATGRGERLITARIAKMREHLGLRTKHGLIVWWMTSPDRAAFLCLPAS
ncbi:hypothetical protein ACIF70_39225 [Actinacidiphila glaucinigra]|uniref:hypothetical protein n=1 Tax=Actinacidiphila glaucinigra TaxID=235986 RepID=UPI0037C7420B